MKYLSPDLSQTRNIKRSFLTILIVSSLLGIAFYFASVNSINTNPSDPDSILSLVGTLGLTSIVGFAIGYLYYYCAYRKNGTKLLLISLIVSPPRILANLSFLSLAKPIVSLYGLLIIAKVVSEIIFWLESFRLYKINKQLQKQSK